MRKTQLKNAGAVGKKAFKKSEKRDCSQILLVHWWFEDARKKRFPASQERSIDEQKTALLYEAARRNPIVQKAWVDGYTSHCVAWQPFIAKVLDTIKKPWSELCDTDVAGRVVAERSYFLNEFPYLIPPRGYSFFPTILKLAKGSKGQEKDGLNASHNRAMNAAVRILNPPSVDNIEGVELSFLNTLRQLKEQGFTILALDTKTQEARREAISKIKTLPTTYRKQDIELETSFLENGQVVINEVVKKRLRKDILVEEKKFDYYALCLELAKLDEGEIENSDFVSRIVLGS